MHGGNRGRDPCAGGGDQGKMRLDITIRFAAGGSITMNWNTENMGGSTEMALLDHLLARIREYAQREVIEKPAGVMLPPIKLEPR